MQFAGLLFVFFLACIGDVRSENNNGRCTNATYIVSQMYQACPPRGRVVVESGAGNSAATTARLDVLEAKYKALESLESRYKALESRLDAVSQSPCQQQQDKSHNPVKDVVHNVTKANGSLPTDCTEIFKMGYRCTGVYWIKPKDSPRPFKVLCELSYEGWTVLMRRFNGEVDFYRKWTDYKNGFGSPSGEHWLGNDKIHLLTSQKNYQLRVDVTYWDNGYTYYTDYKRFKVESEATKYKLIVSDYSGISGYNGLEHHNNRRFSTWDQDNDDHSTHCAQIYKGGWWHGTCHNAQLTGLYASPCVNHSCMEWNRKPLKASVMKVKSI